MYRTPSIVQSRAWRTILLARLSSFKSSTSGSKAGPPRAPQPSKAPAAVTAEQQQQREEAESARGIEGLRGLARRAASVAAAAVFGSGCSGRRGCPVVFGVTHCPSLRKQNNERRLFPWARLACLLGRLPAFAFPSPFPGPGRLVPSTLTSHLLPGCRKKMLAEENRPLRACSHRCGTPKNIVAFHFPLLLSPAPGRNEDGRLCVYSRLPPVYIAM